MGQIKKRKWNEYMWIVSATYLTLGFFNSMFAWIGLLYFFIPLVLYLHISPVSGAFIAPWEP